MLALGPNFLTFFKVKIALVEKANSPVEQLCLIFSGKILKDNETLKQHGIIVIIKKFFALIIMSQQFFYRYRRRFNDSFSSKDICAESNFCFMKILKSFNFKQITDVL